MLKDQTPTLTTRSSSSQAEIVVRVVRGRSSALIALLHQPTRKSSARASRTFELSRAEGVRSNLLATRRKWWIQKRAKAICRPKHYWIAPTSSFNGDVQTAS